MAKWYKATFVARPEITAVNVVACSSGYIIIEMGNGRTAQVKQKPSEEKGYFPTLAQAKEFIISVAHARYEHVEKMLETARIHLKTALSLSEDPDSYPQNP